MLTDAAIQSRSDYMRGLKENVIGKLIPAGTGSPEYQELVPALEGATTVDALAILGADPDALDEDRTRSPAPNAPLAVHSPKPPGGRLWSPGRGIEESHPEEPRWAT